MQTSCRSALLELRWTHRRIIGDPLWHADERHISGKERKQRLYVEIEAENQSFLSIFNQINVILSVDRVFYLYMSVMAAACFIQYGTGIIYLCRPYMNVHSSTGPADEGLNIWIQLRHTFAAYTLKT